MLILASCLCVTCQRTFLCTRKLVWHHRGWCSACSEHINTNECQTNIQDNATVLVQPSWCKAMMVRCYLATSWFWNTHTCTIEWVYAPSHTERSKISFLWLFSQVSTGVRYQERNRQRGSTRTQAAFTSENESLRLRISLWGLKKWRSCS